MSIDIQLVKFALLSMATYVASMGMVIATQFCFWGLATSH